MSLQEQLNTLTKNNYGKDIAACSNAEVYYSLLNLTKELTAKTPAIEGDKKIYYISAEFLIGKLLSNNLINLGIYDEVKEVLAANGKKLSEIEEIEPEPSLGNGGLGRLAACFIDSIATLGLPGEGIGLNYHFGLFKQVFEKNLQKETKNDWIEDQSWLNKTDISFDVEFGDCKVKSVLYDIDVIGYENGVNKLRLFDVETIDESIVKDGISFDKEDIAKNLTLFLYPDDSDEAGNLLRIYQQYFMVSNGAQLILKDAKAKGYDLHKLYDHAVIQINDTHPSMVIPELIRLLKAEGISMDEAIEIVSKTCAYTNHTILAEALEKWPLKYLEKVVPQLVPIIKELDKRVAAKYKDEKVQIIERLKNFPVWFARCRHCRGFGVQSPWAYAFIRYVIGEKWPYYAYKRLDKHSPELSWKEKKQYRLFFRIANYCRSACIMDFSACNDICGMYIKAGSVNSKIMKIMPDKTPEEYAEAIDKAGTPGFVLMSFTGNWRSFFKELAAHADNKTLAVVTGINRDCNSRRCWKEIVSSKKSIITFDLYYCGIVFFDKKRYKQHYIVNF